jgi:hypothetical protein
MLLRSSLNRVLNALLVTCLMFAAMPGTVQAQDEDEFPKIRFDGQFRLRAEGDGRTTGFKPDFATLSRIRGGARVGLMDWIRAYVQLQDARAWGSEINTLTDAGADNFDMHQGYAELGSTDAFTARLGRQEAPLADERLVGAVGWSNTGRSFDGVRVLGVAGGIGWSAFAYNVVERDSLLTVGLHPQLNQGVYDDGWLIGGFASKTFGDVNSELTALYDVDAITEKSYTVNLRLHGRSGVVLYEGAGAYQGGPSRSAYFGSGRLGVAIGKGTIAAQVDYLSGDDDPASGDIESFTTLYATNHKFYGIMDYFLAPRLQLDGAGLVDAVLRGSLDTGTNTRLSLDLHRFNTAKKRGGETALGTELDLVGNWKFAKPGAVQAGFGVFFPEDLVTQLLPAFQGGKDTTWWGYVQMILNWP